MSDDIKTSNRNRLFRVICLVCILCAGTYFIGKKVGEHKTFEKDATVAQLNTKYKKLINEHKKSQDIVEATTKEIKRLTKELKKYKNNEISELIFNKSNIKLGIDIVSDHIKENESFSAMAYQDADGKYRNGFGTEAKLKTYKVGQTVKIRNAKGQIIILTATEHNRKLPEANITEQEALKRKEEHLVKYVFPYLYGKHFRSAEEFIVATDVIYNRGINQCKALFNSNGTINCKSLYSYMNHSKKAYQKAISKRYAKNYALCIQS